MWGGARDYTHVLGSFIVDLDPPNAKGEHRAMRWIFEGQEEGAVVDVRCSKTVAIKRTVTRIIGPF